MSGIRWSTINAASFPYHIAGAVRATNASKIINGSLKSIKHQYVGTSILVYEPNDYTLSGTLTKFKGIEAISGETIAIPDYKLQFINQAGLSDFQVSGVNLNHDRHYIVAEKYIQYSNIL